VNPDAAEDCGDYIDNDCDGAIDDQDPDCAPGDDDTSAADDDDTADDESGCECRVSGTRSDARALVMAALLGWMAMRRRSRR